MACWNDNCLLRLLILFWAENCFRNDLRTMYLWQKIPRSSTPPPPTPCMLQFSLNWNMFSHPRSLHTQHMHWQVKCGHTLKLARWLPTVKKDRWIFFSHFSSKWFLLQLSSTKASVACKISKQLGSWNLYCTAQCAGKDIHACEICHRFGP